MKVCTGCKQELDYSKFHRLKKSPDGYDWRCKECVNKYNEEWLSRPGVWEKRRQRQLEYSRKNPHISKKAHVKWAYGLTDEEHQTMWAKQDSKCAICGTLLEPNTAEIDRDHATGKVRGLLCKLCNQLLGRAKDDKKILASAIRYLEACE